MSLSNPVKYPVKHYSHLDAGAPQIADADGAIKTILKACLVTGYGTKASAGWTALFDDAFRIVLRRPLRTGNPPDIKIENGIINSVASHRIVSQDNPTGLDDTTEITAANLLTRDNKYGQEWHLIVSDFGFLLCYQMGEYGYSGDKQYLQYCGSAQNISSDANDIFITNTNAKISSNGRGALYITAFLSSPLKDMRTGTEDIKKSFISIDLPEKSFNNDFFIQPIVAMDKTILPFYCSITKNTDDKSTAIVSIDNRPMLRYCHKLFGNGYNILYVPLDYWEL